MTSQITVGWKVVHEGTAYGSWIPVQQPDPVKGDYIQEIELLLDQMYRSGIESGFSTDNFSILIRKFNEGDVFNPLDQVGMALS